MVMIDFVRVATFDKSWDGCHLDPPGGHLGESEAAVEERHTGSLLLLLRFLRSCGAHGSQTPVVAYRILGTLGFLSP
jgi:hypothetical protein